MDKKEFIERAEGFMTMALSDPKLIGNLSWAVKDDRCFRKSSGKNSKNLIPNAIFVLSSAQDKNKKFDLQSAVEFFLASVDPHIPDVIYRNIIRRSESSTFSRDIGSHYAECYVDYRMDYVSFETLWDNLDPYFKNQKTLLRQNEKLHERVENLERALNVASPEISN